MSIREQPTAEPREEGELQRIAGIENAILQKLNPRGGEEDICMGFSMNIERGHTVQFWLEGYGQRENGYHLTSVLRKIVKMSDGSFRLSTVQGGEYTLRGNAFGEIVPLPPGTEEIPVSENVQQRRQRTVWNMWGMLG
jgi:hypothetical protein